jgi:hypothetical protein
MSDSYGRTWLMGSAEERVASVADLRLPDNAIAQVSALPDQDGFLIRVWPPNGTHEYGGTNLTVLTVAMKSDGTIIRFHSDPEAS